MTISDDLSGDGGSLDSWALHIHGGECSTTTTTSTSSSTSTSTSSPTTTSTSLAGATTTTINGGSSTTTTLVGLGRCGPGATFKSLRCRLGKVPHDAGAALRG